LSSSFLSLSVCLSVCLSVSDTVSLALFLPLQYFTIFGNFQKWVRDRNHGEISFWQNFGAASLAGSIAAGTVTPADVIKTRLQTAGNSYAGLWDCGTTIFRQEGVKALFKGVVPR
jgi:hypothetical protein